MKRPDLQADFAGIAVGLGGDGSGGRATCVSNGAGWWSIVNSGGDRKVHMVAAEEQVEQTSKKEGI
jgi:hypothetical protein